MIANHQRIGAISNAHVGRDFETAAQAYFRRSEGITLQPSFPVHLGAGIMEKSHRFDLGSENPPILVECKSHRWTESGNLPSAKVTVWNEATYLFHSAPPRYRKVLFVLRSDHPHRTETLAQYYVRTCRHLIPPTVSIIEYDEQLETARYVKTALE